MSRWDVAQLGGHPLHLHQPHLRIFRHQLAPSSTLPASSISSIEIAADSTLGVGDFAATLERANWVTEPKGSDAPTRRSRFLMVWRREPDGRWRTTRELLNEDL